MNDRGFRPPSVHSRFARAMFFWSGILATIFYRAIIFFNGHSQLWVNILWYAGTIGFIIYFAHRYQVAKSRARLIAERDLRKKIESLHDLSQDDKSAVEYIFRSLEVSKEKWNYIVIFASSGFALVVGFLLDFVLKK